MNMKEQNELRDRIALLEARLWAMEEARLKDIEAQLVAADKKTPTKKEAQN